MRILSTQYTLANKSLEIYISGCMASPHCEGCHNPESWDFDLGEVYDINYFYKIKRKIEEFPSLVKKVCTGRRPSGIVLMVKISRSPNAVSASVCGIGVALIIRRFGSESFGLILVRPLSIIAPRCITPNLCCSSMIVRARSWY